jgi:3-methyladenine DNA glycosylase AlkD
MISSTRGKATGYMLREAGKRDHKQLCTFFDQHAAYIPRTMLRYALEKLITYHSTHEERKEKLKKLCGNI